MKYCTLIFCTVLLSFTGCKKDINIQPTTDRPVDAIYDAYYVDAVLDSLVCTRGEFQQFNSVSRNDTSYTVYKWDDYGNSSKHLHIIENDLLKRIETTYLRGPITHSIERYQYINAVLDSSDKYNWNNTGDSVLAYRKAYRFNDPNLAQNGVANNLTITSTDIINWPSFIYKVEQRLYGNNFELFTPFDLFPFSSNKLTKHEVVLEIPRDIGGGRPGLLNIRHTYDLNQNTLRITNYAETYHGAGFVSTDTTLTIINYHGI